MTSSGSDTCSRVRPRRPGWISDRAATNAVTIAFPPTLQHGSSGRDDPSFHGVTRVGGGPPLPDIEHHPTKRMLAVPPVL